MEAVDRFRGTLLGLAAGDALGTTLEFKPPGSFDPIDDIVGGGPFGLRPGEWTDDTSMALCLAESLVERGGFDARDQMERYLRWRDDGYMSPNGRGCFDIGLTVSQALANFELTGEPFSGSTDPYSAGNGSIMRLAPVPLAYAREPRRAIEIAADSSRTTHGAATAVDACRYLAALIVGAINGVSKDELLSPRWSPIPGLWDEPLAPEIDEIAAGSFKLREPPEIKGSGYVVKSLEAALWAFHRSENFCHGALLAVNLGDDADTTGAVFGQLAGAYYGEAGIPTGWLDKIAQRELIAGLADELHTPRTG